MTKQIIGGVLVLLLVLAGIFWWQNKRKEKTGTILSISAFNQNKNQNATETAAGPGDIIVYSLNVENPGKKVVSGFVLETNISDITELANLTDASGANYNPATGTLVWTPLDIPPKESIEKKFTVRVKDELPANSDMIMSAKFNNEIKISVAKPQVAGNAQPSPSITPSPTPVGPGSSPGNFQSPNSGPSAFPSLFLGIISTLIFFSRRRSVQRRAV